MATNYSESKADVEFALNTSTLSSDISAKILQGLGSIVLINEIDSAPAGADLHGNDIVEINTGGTVDLSRISKWDIKGVDALIFATNEDVNFTLDGVYTKSFKGVVTTNAGDDTIKTNSTIGVTASSGDGDDSVTTGSGNDSVNLGAGDDTVHTGAGNDTVSAGPGNDSIDTGAGNDSVSTGPGNDSVTTGAGNDSVYVGSGNDSVNTGAGNDIVKLATGFSGNAQLDGAEEALDKLNLGLVIINNVVENGAELTITLFDNSVITVTNFEQFIYDSNGADTAGGIQIVGVDQFVDNFSI